MKKILVDVYHDNIYLFTVNEFTHLDIRKQITEQNLDGFSLKINPQFWHLFDVEDKIEDHVVNINNNGEVSNWFQNYDLNDDYKNLSVFSETLSIVLVIRSIQKDKEVNKK